MRVFGIHIEARGVSDRETAFPIRIDRVASRNERLREIEGLSDRNREEKSEAHVRFIRLPNYR